MSVLPITFRPFNPRTWPSLYLLLTLLPVVAFLHKTPLSVKPETTLSLTIIVLLVVIIKAKTLLNDRYERFSIFDKGNIPSVGNKNVFSGNLFECIVPSNNMQIIDDYHKKFGKTFGMFYGPDPWVYTTDLDLLHKMFVADSGRNIDVTQFRLPFMTEMNNSLASIQGEEWRMMRRLLNPSFTHRQMKSDNVYVDVERTCDKLIDCIEQHPIQEVQIGQDRHSCRIVEVEYLCKRYTIEVIFQVAYGREHTTKMEADKKDPLIDAISEGALLIRNPVTWLSIMLDNTQKFLGPLVQLTPIGGYVRFIHKILDESLQKRRKLAQTIDPRERKMIDSIIESVDKNKIDNDKLKANLFFIFIAGFETTANTLTILFWLLAKHQEVQEKLRSSLTIEGSESKYLHWCIQETLRLHPAVPSGAGRILQEDFEYEGKKFFKGTSINASIYSIHHSEEYWGEDVEQFRPERFEEPQANQHPLQFFAFAHGPRYCIGMNLAYAEIKALVPRILLKYRLNQCSTTPEKLNTSSQNLVHTIIHDDIDLAFVEISSL